MSYQTFHLEGVHLYYDSLGPLGLLFIVLTSHSVDVPIPVFVVLPLTSLKFTSRPRDKNVESQLTRILL